MTIERLQQYASLVAHVKAIVDEINTYYNPVSSPNGEYSVGSGTSVPVAGDPTRKAVFTILTYKEKLEAMKKEQMQLLSDIDEWLMTIDDYAVNAIIRRHYILGETWAETNTRVFGYTDKDYCRKRFLQYKRENPEKFL